VKQAWDHDSSSSLKILAALQTENDVVNGGAVYCRLWWSICLGVPTSQYHSTCLVYGKNILLPAHFPWHI
jgi:hypothetical protein